MKIRFLAGMAASLLLATSVAAQSAASPSKDLIKVNIGGPSAGYFMTYVANDLGLYQKHGLDPQLHWFTSGAPLLAALKSGSIDQVVTGLAAVFALGQNVPLKIISWELDNAQGAGLMASEASGIKSFRDIGNAKKIGATSGTCSQVSLKLMADKAGVDFKKLNIVNLAPPLFANAFAGNAIDTAIGWAPWTMNLPAGVKMVAWDSEYGGVCPSVNGLRTEFMEKNPSVAEKLIAVQAEAREIIEKNPQIAIESLQKYLQMTPQVAKAFYEKHCCGNLPSFEQQLDPASPYSLVAKDGGLAGQLHVASQVLHELGVVPKPLTLGALSAAIDAGPMRRFVDGRQARQ